MRRVGRTRRTARTGSLGMALLLSFLLLSTPPATAHEGHNGPFSYDGCTVTMRQFDPQFTDLYGGHWADGRALASTSSCDRTQQVWVCYDYKYEGNDGVWYGWHNSSPSDDWRFARNGCTNNVGSTGSSDAFSSFGFAYTAYRWHYYTADCSKFRAVKLRTSSWVVSGGGQSAVHRSDLLMTLLC